MIMSTAVSQHVDLKPPNGVSAGPEGIGPEDLHELMRTFTESSRELQETHQTLQTEVNRLQRELADANAQLQRSESLAALGGMAAGIAHEIRNPLGSIQLYVQMLQEDLEDRPEQAQVCSKIARAVSSLDAIVGDVLVFARELKVNSSPTCVSELFGRALEGCHALIARNDVEVKIDGSLEQQLKGDEILLSQALGNILRNALEAMIEWNGNEDLDRRLVLGVAKRRVRCPDGKKASRLVLRVEDNGPGIDDEVTGRMFNPFFTTRATGTGLGLAIVHRIVDAHGGHVNVKRLEPHGTRFELCLHDDPLPPQGPDLKERADLEDKTPEIETFTPCKTEHRR